MVISHLSTVKQSYNTHNGVSILKAPWFKTGLDFLKQISVKANSLGHYLLLAILLQLFTWSNVHWN